MLALSPSMRRPVGVKWVLLFFHWTRFFSGRVSHCRHPSIRTLVSDLHFARCKLGVLAAAKRVQTRWLINDEQNSLCTPSPPLGNQPFSQTRGVTVLAISLHENLFKFAVFDLELSETFRRLQSNVRMVLIPPWTIPNGSIICSLGSAESLSGHVQIMALLASDVRLGAIRRDYTPVLGGYVDDTNACPKCLRIGAWD